MKNFKPRTYTQKIQLRIKMSYFLLVLMLIYMVVMGELGRRFKSYDRSGQHDQRLHFFRRNHLHYHKNCP